jgi:ornithine carbamoyltransferase
MSTPLRHFLGLKGIEKKRIREILALAARYKAERKSISWRPLAGQTWALIFTKSSTRTRVSFEVGIRELGGNALFLNANDLQLGRGEPIKDTARVLGRMVHGAVIRTYAQSDVEEFARYAQIPTINALTDDEHPCQIVADIQTIEEKLGPIAGRKIAFIGDCACNVARSWVYAAEALKFHLALAGPEGYLSDGHEPLCHADARREGSGAGRRCALHRCLGLDGPRSGEGAAGGGVSGYQINHDLLALAKKHALVQHCLPAYREQEISGKIFEERAGEIFDQAENRLHGLFFFSGVLGFGMGDWALFEAIPRIGPALTILLCQCVAVPIGALTEGLWLGTTMTALQVASSALILIGVALALAPGAKEIIPAGHRIAGFGFGLLAAAGQAWGAVLSRYAFQRAHAIGLSIDGITAAYQRIWGGVLSLGLLLLLGAMHGRWRPSSAEAPQRAWRKASLSPASAATGRRRRRCRGLFRGGRWR